MGIYVSIFVSTLAIYPIIKFGSEDQKERFLKPLCSKFGLASYCLSELTVGSDPASMKTTATLNGDHYLLNGTKMWITNGGYADFYLVFANTDLQKRHKGIICLIVPSHLEGIRHGEPIDKMGQRASKTTAVIFKNVRVPRENLLAAEGEGFKKALDLEAVLQSKTFKAAVDQDWLRSHHLGITAVPTFRMNEENLVGAQPHEQLAAFMTAQGVPPRNAPAAL